MGAVSYTHLDVYKRQALDTDERSASKDGQAVDLTAKEFDLMEPVSYTHLDVYKRQL